MYRLWKVEFDGKHTKVTNQEYISCQSKNQLIGAISKELDEDEEYQTIEDIAILKTKRQNQP